MASMGRHPLSPDGYPTPDHPAFGTHFPLVRLVK